MTIHASVHTDPATQYETHATTVTGHGYVRIKPDAAVELAAVVIHGQAPEMRRLAAACLALADEMDPPTYDDAYDAALLASYGRINDLYQNSPRMGETE